MIRKLAIAISFLVFSLNAQAQPVGNTLGLSQASLTFKAASVVNTAQAVKNSTAIMCGYYLHCARASTCFFKFYNATATAINAAGLANSIPKLTYPLPAGASANAMVECNRGIGFTTAISIACTTGVADNDNGAPSANECVANIYYK